MTAKAAKTKGAVRWRRAGGKMFVSITDLRLRLGYFGLSRSAYYGARHIR